MWQRLDNRFLGAFRTLGLFNDADANCERGKKTTQTKEEVGRQHQGIWTDLKFGKSQRAVENRGKWRKLVAKSSVVPERPSRLRD